jgi:hypothetical protein
MKINVARIREAVVIAWTPLTRLSCAQNDRKVLTTKLHNKGPKVMLALKLT